ncbi:hypothetical protein Daesc_008499 [Daldinia eschscholtzii]|uniref:Uncharacterized protein n=1 Tax=Daldinia eschscholtzii TaxID=292717 RepID=A0AAX6MCH4_9PEZI
MIHPIAKISCWIVEDPLEGYKPPGRAISVGRDHHVNEISINHPNVSRNHFVIYSIIYDLNDVQKQPYLVYVRDCKSLEGTYVGKKCIGSKEDDAPRGFYIGKDVVITVKPYWRFRVSLLYHTELKNPLNSIQLKESNLFRHRYLITDRTLGRGTFANVHLALEVRTGKQLACKVHDLDRVRQLAPSRDLIRRIIDETDLLGKLKHHEGGIAHRDLKPENIFFATGPGITGRVIVGDLGLAKSTSSGRMASRVGTDQYMAPEVEYGETHDLAVDIWSLGMILVFLLAPDENAVPSSAMNINQAAIAAWLDSVFEDPSQQKITDECQSFIRSCLMFEPAHRLRSFKAKNHPWFQQRPDEGRLKFLIQENTDAWKPAHAISPPVQELPDIEEGHSMTNREQDRRFYSSTRSTSLGEMSPLDAIADDDGAHKSPYFTRLRPITPKRPKITEGTDKIPRTIRPSD